MSTISVQNAASCERRKRKSKVTSNLEKTEDWTNEEKCQLLQALRKYGHLDMKNLCKSVPTKNKENIKLFINLLWGTANKSSGNYTKKCHSKRGGNAELEKLPVIDKWLHLLLSAQPRKKYSEIKCLPIARAFYFISQLEKHPDPVYCNGIDFRNMDTPTSQFLLKSFKELGQDIKQQNLDKRIQFLNELKFVNYVDRYSKNSLPDIKVRKMLQILCHKAQGQVMRKWNTAASKKWNTKGNETQ